MIKIEDLRKSYRSKKGLVNAVGHINLTVERGEFVSIVGPSGCGKSTILNMIAGFMAPSAGTISIEGQTVSGDIPKGLGYIFQKDTLLPWYTVSRNVSLGLEFAGVSRAEIARRVERLLALGHLSSFANAYPHQLSGGMRRRVALLMSLATEPKILLLDEPFGALDTHTRTHLHKELMEICRALNQTVVMVTHDLDEAVTLSNRVIVLSGPPSTILHDEVITLPKERDVFTVRQRAEFLTHFQNIWSVLGDQFRSGANT